jgi:type IV pilus assembly protein PilW
MNSHPIPPAMAKARGFTLVEVMVAMVIGMIGIIIMMQVFASAEGQKRTTTGTGDAQSNGAMAIYTLQRDIREAGYGFNALNALGCALVLPSRTLTQLAPVVINPPIADVPAGDANTDTLLIAYGNGEGSPEGDVITAVPSATVIGVQTAASFSVGSQVIAAPSGPTDGCSLTLAKVESPIAAPNLTTSVASGAVDGGTLFNLGINPRIRAYAVRGGNLTYCDYINDDGDPVDCSLAANYVAISNNIVSLRAQYGRDTTATADGIDTWDQNPLLPAPASAEIRACRWARASALRIAVVARNSQVDQGILTAQAPVWAGSEEDTAGVRIDLSEDNRRRRPLEELPLQGLRDGDPHSQPGLDGNMYALSHKPVPTPALAGSGPPSERSVVLLVALIILVALTLAGVALIRSVDTANIIAGNLSFRESAVHAGERSTQMAIDGLRTMALEDPILLHNDRAGNGYFATRDDPPVGTSWETFWETTLENQAVVTARDGSTPACPDWDLRPCDARQHRTLCGSPTV